jgi:hypothetical protein
MREQQNCTASNTCHAVINIQVIKTNAPTNPQKQEPTIPRTQEPTNTTQTHAHQRIHISSRTKQDERNDPCLGVRAVLGAGLGASVKKMIKMRAHTSTVVDRLHANNMCGRVVW